MSAPTPKDAMFMMYVLQAQSGTVKVDWDQVAEKMGLKNGSTASVRFGQIKKKLGWVETKTGVSPSKVTKSPGRRKVAASPSKKMAIALQLDADIENELDKKENDEDGDKINLEEIEMTDEKDFFPDFHEGFD